MSRARTKGGAIGWGVSVALHASVIGAGTALVWTIERSESDPEPTEATTVVFYDAGLVPDAPAAEKPEPEASATEELDRLFEPAAATQEPSRTRMDLPRELLTDPVDLTPPRTPESAPSPPPTPMTSAIERDAEFFGTGASDARLVVYVVDASGSSVALFPAIARELARSLDGLNATQKATVIAAMGEPPREGRAARGVTVRATEGLVRMTTRRARTMAEWFAAEVTPSGRADLGMALREAMTLGPDAVFLLATPGGGGTDRDGFLRELDRLNPVDDRTGTRRAIIGVVSVGPPAAGDPLLEIVRLHGGDAPLVVLERAALLEGNRP